MGWTVNQGRRRDRLRRRPHLEHLDDRCLLSTGLEGNLIAAPTLREHATAAIRIGHHDATQGKGGELVVRHHGRAHANRERPAGTMTSTTSAGAPYDSIIGASQVQSNYNVNGSGMTVAVIDTGVDYNNPALGDGYGPGAKVIAGYDFADNSTNPMAVYSQHGTAVAGIIGSDSPSDPGVAPGVNIVALRVTDSSNTSSLSSIANALQWVINNHAQYNITVVNMSLSDGNNYAHNWFATTGGEAEQVTNLIGQLRGINIPVVVATGNSFTGQQGEGFAAIVQGTISVTATDLSGNLLPDAQRLGTSIGGSSATVIAAPGEGFTAPSGDSGTSSVDGTSFATPLVSGAIVLLQQIYEERFGTLPTVDQIQSWIQGGSDPIHDPVTGITLGELDIPKAAALIPTASSAITPTPSPTSTLQVSTASVAPTPSSTATQTTTTVTAPAAPAVTTTAISSPTPTPTPPPTTAPAAPAVTTTAVSSPTPTPTPPPTTAPAPAPATSSQQVISVTEDQSAASSSSSSGSAPPAVSGLALLLQSMKVWAASSSRG